MLAFFKIDMVDYQQNNRIRHTKAERKKVELGIVRMRKDNNRGGKIHNVVQANRQIGKSQQQWRPSSKVRQPKPREYDKNR